MLSKIDLLRYLQANITLVALSFAMALPAFAEEATNIPSKHTKHMGVATCANVACHGVRQLENDSNVKQNEYQTWLLQDPHAKAYKTLLNSESQNIAKKLGLKSAESADICLDCHTDNVPTERRGSEFQISDGVGCEACHGGSETWLSRHVLKPYSAERNLSDGMYPTAPLQQRAELCISCHIGTAEKFANHDIMGAGHPRISFELNTFSNRQPMHHVVDADYLTRKNADDHLSRLLIGMAVQAQTMANNLKSNLLDGSKGHPEIALYDCHSCHHSLTDLQWQKRPSTLGLKPGSVRLNDSSFLLLAALAGALDPNLQNKIQRAIQALHTASTTSASAVKHAASQLAELANSSRILFEQSKLGGKVTEQMINNVIKLGIEGEYLDYLAAEQAVMALDALSLSTTTNPSFTQLIDQAYRLTESDEAYQPDALKRLLLGTTQ